MIDKSPALVVQPTGTADVVATVNFAREHDLLLSIKGGGHNIAGTALADGGLTIDMSRLRGVLVAPRRGRRRRRPAACSATSTARRNSTVWRRRWASSPRPVWLV